MSCSYATCRRKMRFLNSNCCYHWCKYGRYTVLIGYALIPNWSLEQNSVCTEMIKIFQLFFEYSLVQVLYACTIGIINSSHSLFKTVYGTPEQLKEIANMIKARLNLPNPFTMNLAWECNIQRCPKLNNNNWITMTLEQWRNRNNDTLPFPVEDLPEAHDFALTDMCMY